LTPETWEELFRSSNAWSLCLIQAWYQKGIFFMNAEPLYSADLLNYNLREATPLCAQNRHRKIGQTQQEVIYCYAGQLVSTQLWGYHQASD
jgi:hypothetical protein